MTTSFLVFANIWLCTRLVCLFRDDVTAARLWCLKALVEVVAVAALYPCTVATLGVQLTVALLNFAGYWLERRSRRRDFSRLVLGLVGLIALSCWFSPRLELVFRPEVHAWADRLGNWTALHPLWHALGGFQAQLILFGLLISANESNLVIRALFDWLDLKPRSLPTGSDVVDVREFNRGRVIGVLERGLLYSFVLQSQYGAIGFILAAKAFTRFKALDDRPFAEYVLIGTLLSACLALAIGGAIRALLAH